MPTCYYEILGIERHATMDQIKKSYRKLAIRFHPDKNPGDDSCVEKFKEISTAYEVLCDEEKRDAYDRYGHDGVNGNMRSGGMDAEDIFSHFFGMGGMGGFPGMGGRHSQRQSKKGDPVRQEIQVSLEDVYLGRKTQLEIEKTIVCTTCSGGGLKPGARKISCHDCDGIGKVIGLRRIGPMVQQYQKDCSSCRGKGSIVRESDKCITCKGRCLSKSKKRLDIFIEKGMEDGHKIVLSGEGDATIQRPIPSDIHVIIKVVNRHPTFERHGSNLLVNMKINLQEALCGVTRYITHLDGRSIQLRTNPGEVISPGMMKKIEGEGMPTYKRPFEKGNLVFVFDVEFPNNGFTDPHSLTKLAEILPSPKIPKRTQSNVDEYHLKDTTKVEWESSKRQKHQSAVNSDDDYEDEEEDGSPHVQCAQQ